jgi:hypothetical protein
MQNSAKPNFLLLFRFDRKSTNPTPEEMQATFGRWVAWLKDLKAQGSVLGSERLTDAGRVVRNARGASVTDGPFAEAKEIVAGYVIVTAADLEEATAVAQGCPGLEYGYIVEVRPIEQRPAF